jgi:hypothetical protein
MSDTPRIALDEADFASLKRHAEVNLGIEVKLGVNAAQLRAKIRQVAPETVEIEPVEMQASVRPTAVASRPQGVPSKYDIRNPATDPKVTLTIHKTADVTRAKDVQVPVNGRNWILMRGERVTVPYRVYEALENAKEQQPVATNKTNHFGSPIYDYDLVHSYPFTVHEMPPREEVEAWLAVQSETAIAA